MSDCVVRTTPLGGSTLSRSGRAGELPDWYLPVPQSVAGWSAYGERVRGSVRADWLSTLHDAIAPHGRAAARLERSGDGRGLVVTTGQQPGLFGGPLMSLVKAISARALADVLQEALEIPVAPLFWAATDDADFEEAAVVSVALTGGARELRLEPLAPAGTPMARVPIGDDVNRLADRLREASGSAAHPSYLDAALHAYQPGTTIGDAYVSLLRTVLEPFDIAVLDASHGAVWRAAEPLMRRAVMHADVVADALRRRNDEITARGFAPQVQEVPGLSLVFLNSSGIKRRLSDTERTILDTLSAHDFLSATVLLRPVVERALLPTASYVAGPGEFAYFAQVTAAAAALESPLPMVVPRWSTSVLEPRIIRILEELDIAPDALVNPAVVEGMIARQRLAPETDAALRALRSANLGAIGAVRATNDGIVPDTVLEGLQRSIEHRVERVERRFLAGVKRRESDVMRAIGTARGALYPHGAPQERKLAYIAFLARYGSDLVDALLAAARVHARSLIAGPPREARQPSPVTAKM